MIAVSFDPKIKTVEQGQAWMTDYIKNPPTSPIEAVKKFADVTGVSGTLTTALSSIIPGASFIMPALSGILSLFGSGVPSIGELTLNAISDLSKQVSAVAQELKKALTAEIEVSAQKTIDIVLAGQTEIAQQQSAAAVLTSAIQASILDDAERIKNNQYADFLAESQKAQEQAISDLTKMVNDTQKAINAFYDNQLADVIAQLSALIGPFLDLFQSYLDKKNAPVPVQSRAIATPAAVAPGSLPDSGAGSNSMILIIAGIALLIVISQKKKKN